MLLPEARPTRIVLRHTATTNGQLEDAQQVYAKILEFGCNIDMLIESLIALTALASTEASLADLAEERDVAAVHARLHVWDVDVNEAQGDGMTALHWAAFHDDVDVAKLVIGAKASLEVRTRVGSITPLILASKNGSAEMVELLVAAGADPNQASSTGATALMGAAMSGSVAAVNVLLDAAADVNARETHHGQTPLIFAAWENRPSVIRSPRFTGRRRAARSSPNFPVKSPYGSPGSVKLLVPPTCFWGGTRFEVPRFS